MPGDERPWEEETNQAVSDSLRRAYQEGARSVLERLTSDEAVTSAVALAMPRLWSRERRYEIADAALAAVAAALSSPIESETRDGD